MKSGFLCVVLSSFALTCNAITYTFSPTPADLFDLDHYKYYTWGINWTVPAGEQITGASLTLTNIWDWEVEDDDYLYVHLLDRARKGVKVGTDDQGGGDYFVNSYSGTHLKIGQWSDPVGGVAPIPAFNLVFNFSDTQLSSLISYIGNGGSTTSPTGWANFGLGFDPDCHYWNDDIKFRIFTDTPVRVPEGGGTAVLLGLAMSVVGALRRKLRADG